MRKTIIFLTIAAFFVCLTPCVLNAQPATTGDAGDIASIADAVKQKIDTTFKRIDTHLRAAADELADMNFKTLDARDVIKDLSKRVPFMMDCALIDPSGIMLMVEPAEYNKFEGSNVSDQEQFVKLHDTGRPVLSNVFPTVEGFYAVDFEYPIFSSSDKLIGSVSALVMPQTMLANVIKPIVEGKNVAVWVMQTDGLTLYDPDREEIGKNVFTDPLYKPFSGFVALCTRIAEEETGTGTYEFLNTGMENVVVKDACWTTVGVYGTEWRVVVTTNE